MPRFDGTGPMGFGPRTGWGMGPCGGCGLGWRLGGYYSNHSRVPKADRLSMLTEEERVLSEELEAIREEKQSLQGK